MCGRPCGGRACGFWLCASVPLLLYVGLSSISVLALFAQRHWASRTCTSDWSKEELDAWTDLLVPPFQGASETPVESRWHRPLGLTFDAEGHPSVMQGFLLSYPRSGNLLVRVMIEFLTQRPTLTVYHAEKEWQKQLGGEMDGVILGRRPMYMKDDHPSARRLLKRIPIHWKPYSTAGSIWKAHSLHAAWFQNGQDWMHLIYLVRRPTDCISSELKDLNCIYRWLTQAEQTAAERIVRNTRMFRAWTGPKLLLRYENVLRDPALAIRSLGNFLRVEPRRIELCAFHAEAILDFSRQLLRRRPAAQNVLERAMSLGAQRITLPPDVWATLAMGAQGVRSRVMMTHDDNNTGSGVYYGDTLCPGTAVDIDASPQHQ